MTELRFSSVVVRLGAMLVHRVEPLIFRIPSETQTTAHCPASRRSGCEEVEAAQDQTERKPRLLTCGVPQQSPDKFKGADEWRDKDRSEKKDDPKQRQQPPGRLGLDVSEGGEGRGAAIGGDAGLVFWGAPLVAGRRPWLKRSNSTRMLVAFSML
jgi:hypothetical protein